MVRQPEHLDLHEQAKWDVKADKAAGELYLACSVEQRMHIDAVCTPSATSWGAFECLG